jgi:hypothetical protein
MRQTRVGVDGPMQSTLDFLLTLELTPGFILPYMTGPVHIGKAAKLAGRCFRDRSERRAVSVNTAKAMWRR